MSRIVVSVVALVVTVAGAGAMALERGAAPEKDAELRFAHDGAEGVVTMTLTVNGSEHVAWTDAFVNPGTGEVTLNYGVIQNADRLVRHQKRIELTWRVKGGGDDATKYKVVGSVVQLKGEQIKKLGEGLGKLVATRE